MITCDFAFLADFAAERGGFITAHGLGVDNLIAPQVPISHPHLYLVAQFRCPASETGTKTLNLRLLDETGTVILDQTGQANFQPPTVGTSSVTRLVMGFHMLAFNAYGTNQFFVDLDGQTLAQLPFRISPPPVPQNVN